ncbi:Non-histone chromosomal protein 6 [Mortierella sp. AM989]|nr:Non-histone chromosomal protein 6 [Mortierella sp. AM989]
MSALSSIVNTSPKNKPTSVPTVTNGNGAGIGASQAGQSIENNKSNMTSTTADDIKYKRKYKDLKKRIRDIEEDNDILNIKLSRARKNIHRLRVERSFLFDRLDHSENATHPSGTSSSSSDSDTDDERNEGDGDGSKSHRSHHRHGIDRHKRFRHSYPHHGRHESSHSQSLPAPGASALLTHHNARSKTPPSRGSSIAVGGPAHHSATSSLGQVNDPSQVVSLSLTSAGTGKRANAAQKKRRKDPLAPKRPSNAFFIFSQQHRQQAREEKKEGNQSELTKFLGLQWKSMPQTEKKIYSDLASQDRKRYLAQMIQYEHEHSQGNTGLIDFSQKPSKKTPGKVGRPSKYEKYTAELKARNSGSNGGDIDIGNINISSNSSNNGDINNGNNLLATSINGHASSAKKKMEIHNMINGDTEVEGEDMLSSHDDEDEDVRMEDGATEDDHDDEGEDEQEDVDRDDEDPEEDEDDEATEGGDQDISLDRALPKGITYGRHGDDVDMVDTHRAQGPGLVASA